MQASCFKPPTWPHGDLAGGRPHSKVDWKGHDQVKVLRLLPDRLPGDLVVVVRFPFWVLELRPDPRGQELRCPAHPSHWGKGEGRRDRCSWGERRPGGLNYQRKRREGFGARVPRRWHCTRRLLRDDLCTPGTLPGGALSLWVGVVRPAICCLVLKPHLCLCLEAWSGGWNWWARLWDGACVRRWHAKEGSPWSSWRNLEIT